MNAASERVADDAGQGEEEPVDMSEVDGRQFDSLNDALRVVRIPIENHRFIQRWVDSVGIGSFFERGSYIRAVRRGAGPALEIHSGYTNGFVSEEEVVQALGDERMWPSNRGTGQWGVTHPKAGHARNGVPKGTHPDYGTCPECFVAFSAAGTCSCVG